MEREEMARFTLCINYGPDFEAIKRCAAEACNPLNYVSFTVPRYGEDHAPKSRRLDDVFDVHVTSVCDGLEEWIALQGMAFTIYGPRPCDVQFSRVRKIGYFTVSD